MYDYETLNPSNVSAFFSNYSIALDINARIYSHSILAWRRDMESSLCISQHLSELFIETTFRISFRSRLLPRGMAGMGDFNFN